ncbi:MAG: hypothetical protein A3D21_01350 [Nitrospirae bacterium RIFCSPHIGHO2_02_FULL_42_12]|nr:MAG: hypothetical protein A3D21_01350 [Nitrospirae bacterium RIFCSPHIGHO2_02_FULL_42_12]
MALIIRDVLPVGLFQTNVYILQDDVTKEAIVIDPADEASRILKIINDNELTVKYILLTHAHIDHIGALKELKDSTGAKVLLHKEDVFLYENMHLQSSLFGLTDPLVTDIDLLIEDGMEFGQAGLKFHVIHTPGHSPGSVCYYFPDKLFSGDTLFKNGIGRSDLWGGSHELLVESLRGILLNLDDAIEVYPGHGPSTTIGREKRDNPFIIKEMWYG